MHAITLATIKRDSVIPSVWSAHGHESGKAGTFLSFSIVYSGGELTVFKLGFGGVAQESKTIWSRTDQKFVAIPRYAVESESFMSDKDLLLVLGHYYNLA